MAVNTQKFLPSSKSSAIVSSTKVISAEKIGVDFVKKKIEISKKVIEVNKLLKGTLALKKKEIDDEKKKSKKETREDKEKKLEATAKDKGKSTKGISLPKLGFFDSIKKFFTNSQWLIAQGE